jgi:hypothetical protein
MGIELAKQRPAPFFRVGGTEPGRSGEVFIAPLKNSPCPKIALAGKTLLLMTTTLLSRAGFA